jgi:Fic family protein
MSKSEPQPVSGMPESRLNVDIEPHGERVVPWRQKQKGGSREDRMLREVTVSLPPKISDYSPGIPPFVSTQADKALTAITRLDSAHGEHLTSLSALLLRAESVASSKIEHVEASIDDFARASHGIKANASATSMVASAEALDSLISSVDGRGTITMGNILAAHRILMANDPSEAAYAGRVRDKQNWIGGSDYAPRNTLYVPPPAETVEAYMADLLEFANRDDVPVLLQAAVAHAQFESIHPFTDGNGRIGRALINVILRRRGVTSCVVVPIASALVAKKEAYFEVLGAYREGDAAPIVLAFARAARTSARESETSARRLAELPDLWMARYTEGTGRPPRAGSAALKILELLPTVPFFTTEEMEDRIGGATSSVYGAIEKLADAGILRPLTNRKRKQVWCAGAIVDELEDLGDRVARQTSNDPVWREIQSQVIADLIRHDQARWANLRDVLARAERSADMQDAIDAARLSDDARRALIESIRIPDSVRNNLERLGASDALRQAIEKTRLTDSVRNALAHQVEIPDSVRRSWVDLSESLARQTRLPDLVIDYLDGTTLQVEVKATEARKTADGEVAKQAESQTDARDVEEGDSEPKSDPASS